MKVALLGYGKMGRTIEQILVQNNDEVILKIDDTNLNELQVKNLVKADVAIDFSIPSAAYDNIMLCFKAKTPIVVGTTGWLNKIDEVRKMCLQGENAFFYAPNYSIGVNIFFEINNRMAKIMNSQHQYNISMEEIHHTQKLDSPSGTAIKIADDILDHIDRKQKWSESKKSLDSIYINAIRTPNVPGTHTVCYQSDIDSIEIKHTAHNRMGFAQGAVMAAKWIIGKKGNFGMKDMLNF